MMNLKLNISGTILIALAAAAAFSQNAAAEDPANLVANGNFETSSKTPGWPDGWTQLKAGGSWESEKDNHFLRLTSTAPGSMIMLYREIPIPSGVTLLELTWKQRVSNLKVGAQAWFDARIMMEFKDAGNAKLSPAPPAPYSRKDTGGWQEKTARLTVPTGTVALKFMPALFQVESGQFDLDDIVIKVVNSAPAAPAAPTPPAG